MSYVKFRLVIAASLVVFGITAHSTAVFAESEAIIQKVLIEGNDKVSYQTIISQLRTVAGKPVSSQLLSEDLKRLYSLGHFKDVQIKQNEVAGGVDVIFILKEKPVLRQVEISGNSHLKDADIIKSMRAKPGDFMDEQIVRRDIDGIRKLYEDKGFYTATVRYKIDYHATANHASLEVIVDEGRKRKIKAIQFEGVYWLKAKDVLKRIETKSAKWWFVKGLLKEDVLDLDVERIRAMYDEEGFSDATVSYRLEDTDNPDAIILTFVVDEGRQYLVGDVRFEGNQLFSREQILESIDLKPDAPFSRRSLRKSVSNIQDLYFGVGYMNAKVIFDSFYNDQSGRVDSIYKIKENEITYVDRVIVRGNSKTKDVVIRRELRVYPGEPFDGTALKKSKQRLFNLGFFDEVQFDTVDTNEPNRKNLVVTVKETKTGEFSFGGGFSSIDRAVGFVQIRQKNFDHAKPYSFTGAGQDLAMRVQLGSVRSQGEISWTDPWFMGLPYSVGFDVYKREFNRTRSSGLFFDEDRVGGKIRIGKDLNDNDRVNLSYTFENVEIGSIPDTASTDLKAEEGETNLSRLELLLTRDFRDNRFVPTEGYLVQLGGEVVGGFLGGDRDFWRGTFLGAKYYNIEPIDSVFEMKGRVGISDEYGDTLKVPIFERFYAGGANTIRGYEERRIGPRDTGTSDPIGGEAYWVVNGELTFPLVEGIIKGAAFYDVGAVDAQLDSFGSAEIFQGIGLGVRLKTPIGPVRVDMGYPLDEVEGEDKKLQFYFNMSRGF